MDHTNKQERLNTLRELTSRVEPYLDLVESMFKEQINALQYTHDDLDDFTLEEMRQALANVQKLRGKAWDLWEVLCVAERPLLMREHAKTEGRSWKKARSEKESPEPNLETLENIDPEELMKALIKKISGG